ncbi:DNA-binding transcriptional regulator, AcrR family [Parafrankia irregularis]|uniref:DNA-binding transcriptional regulator, AcrR family n=1 Tax=Parafrankia irregularis TaxID=795642 RepID=A0A0S4QFY0_9ACTN|nr:MULTISPECIES: TetR/AcrR family transcriptional regulator [Parafrankia]MBE3203268.1 TetR/AcrR family transcriptional regulator [Parafrankia sp. CH37]CUU54082.1 DNA-binding transcriptional regulator, AcrR family [Parafrankia irregularis]
MASEPAHSPDGGTVDPRVLRSRAAALAAARAILLEDGWEAVTHVAVATRSGVGRTTLYRHWPDTIALLRDVLREQMEIDHTVPTGVLRDDLTSELEVLRGQLHRPPLERTMRTMIERAPTHPAYGELKEFLYQEGSRVLGEIVRSGIARGELDARLDPSRAVDQLAGPLIYRRLLAGQTFTTTYVHDLVDDFLRAHRPRP